MTMHGRSGVIALLLVLLLDASAAKLLRINRALPAASNTQPATAASLVDHVIHTMRAKVHTITNTVRTKALHDSKQHTTQLRSTQASAEMHASVEIDVNFSCVTKEDGDRIHNMAEPCLSILNNTANLVNQSVMDHLCNPSTGCLPRLLNTSLAPYLPNCTSDQVTVVEKKLNSTIGSIVPLFCLKLGGEYCVSEVISLTEAPLNIEGLCSSQCVRYYMDAFVGPTVDGMSTAFLCMQDSHGHYCLARLLDFLNSEDALSSQFLCSECGAKIIVKDATCSCGHVRESHFYQEMIVKTLASLVRTERSMEIMALKARTNVVQALPACMLQAKIHAAQDIGCCVGSLLEVDQPTSAWVHAMAKSCSLTLPAPCGGGKKITFMITIGNLKITWYIAAENSVTADEYLIGDLGNLFALMPYLLNKTFSKGLPGGGTEIEIQADAVNEDEEIRLLAFLNTIETRRNGGMTLTQMSANLPADARVDANQDLSFSVQAGSIIQSNLWSSDPSSAATSPPMAASTSLLLAVISMSVSAMALRL
ncbi:hypothetical protein GUITHDRAFT_143795 [Guillardia theta CCMP2712]|uniref:Uncharacterized protein n=1 Tax=Guillardia theta (strain CCMP2712) TaxID=905079 RepID=L1IRT2_GUITC|nr:hypothetical protein GUITHDRAFT_143795 [Guillardia theta CCMP2712]EKX38981.1 hypothetical protein GUITHDRAFT_143795 [Guillardia theta CCMP2712]|eukprot:XP_005825961.1 hypothetical protein GUITHDRAFT_143795 [Guillardia theta CCMP2712]